MAIRVRFDKNGFNHPAFGRLGRGKNQGRVYVLPDQFGERETIKVPIMDQTSKPPRQTGEKEITRYKFIPSTAEIIEDRVVHELEQAANEGDAEAAEELDEIKKASRPKVATQEELDKVIGRGKLKKAQSAQERTTGPSRRRRKAPVDAE